MNMNKEEESNMNMNKEEESPGSGDGKDPGSATDELDPALRDALIKRAEAEAAQVQATDLYGTATATATATATEEKKHVVVADDTAVSNARTGHQNLRKATPVSSHIPTEDNEDNILKLVADRASTAVAEQMEQDDLTAGKEKGLKVQSNQNPEDAESLPAYSGHENPSETIEPTGPHQTTWQSSNPNRPGAYMGAPGEALQRANTLRFSLVGASNAAQDELIGQISNPEDSFAQTEPHDGAQPSVATANNNSMASTNDPHLAVANLVDEDSDNEQMRPSADPVDLQAVQQREQNKKRQRHCFVLFLVMILMVAAITIGTVIGTQKQSEPDIVMATPTPSSAPTGVLDILLDRLPDYTLASINNGSETPQWKAWWWLTNHQNVTFLPEWRKMQLFALATFFYAFEGENWNPLIKERWMDDTVEECDWFSSGFGYFHEGKYYELQDLFGSLLPVKLPCNSQGQFTSLELQDLQLSGLHPSLPPELTVMTTLASIRLNLNNISVPFQFLLPAKIFNGPYSLTSLVLAMNLLSGQIPTEFGLLTSLEVLKLSHNQLTGEIPSDLGLLTSLDSLELDGNQLTNTVPSDFGLLTTLKYLSLEENELSDQVPSELGLMESLLMIDLHDNQLTGPLPSDLGLLTTRLHTLHLHENKFSGVVPSQLLLLTSLEELHLYNNQLSGTIPTEIGMLTSLMSLGLQNNSLTGTLPSQLNVTMGLSLYGNQFSGTVPSHLCSFLFCDCSQNEAPPVSTCAGLTEAPPDWPGRFPTTNAAVVLNLHTDHVPWKTKWVWQEDAKVTRIWTTVESGGPLAIPEHVYSSPFQVNADTAYRLIVYDLVAEGFNLPGWITLMAENKMVLYSLVAGEAFAEITIYVKVGADGSFGITNYTSSYTSHL
ncbi:expressed unknown protein [Seminavis robusta]|uniref:Uncharacterized protein n=1 Tax=Seminavis robusta TaxID=568900 RepID=A0A9N8ECJ4_9STRA|nr:expressed unknown protein [Seminavis robusta]|eukprot:Sro974_g226721.1  (887) ;mRNA; f:34791-37451